MRSRTRYVRLLGAGAALLAAASLSLAATDAAHAAPQTKVKPAATNASSTSPLTAAAKAAGAKKFGAHATYDQSLSAYWTPARMAAATPIEDDTAFQSSAKKYDADQQAQRKAGKKPVTNDGPERSVNGAASKVFSTSEGSTLAAYNPNVPYYTPTAYTQGKVFFTKAGGGNYVCSGTIINSEGKDSVWTAGHCVHGGSGGSWHYNWTFVPAYDDDLANPRPYGTWSAAYLSSRTAWTNSSDFSQDIGVATMNTNFGGWHIVDYFGGQGITVNKGKSGVYEYAFGYPAEWPFDGGNLYRCQGSTSPEWDNWFSWSQTVKIPCDMTRGSSGGGWLNGYDGNWGWLNGVNSRIDQIVGPTIMLSPYFDDDAWSLYNYTRYN
jgi:hypothetical protein